MINCFFGMKGLKLSETIFKKLIFSFRKDPCMTSYTLRASISAISLLDALSKGMVALKHDTVLMEESLISKGYELLSF